MRVGPYQEGETRPLKVTLVTTSYGIKFEKKSQAKRNITM